MSEELEPPGALSVAGHWASYPASRPENDKPTVEQAFWDGALSALTSVANLCEAGATLEDAFHATASEVSGRKVK